MMKSLILTCIAKKQFRCKSGFMKFFYQIYLAVISPYYFLSSDISFCSEDVACLLTVEFEFRIYLISGIAVAKFQVVIKLLII